jgi:hypothetical protein
MDIQQIYKERFSTLPEKIQVAILSNDLQDKFNNISIKRSLPLDQSTAIENEALLVMLGLESTKSFIDNIQKNAGLSREKSTLIVHDINSEIFSSIRDSLEEIQLKDESGAEPNQPPAPIKNPTPTPQPQTKTPPPSIPKVQFQPLPTIQTPYKNPITAAPQTQTQPQPQQAPAPIKPTFEQAGRFTVDKPPVGMPQYKESDIKKDNVLKGIEDPEISMVDHLLSKPVNTVSGIEVKKPIDKPVVENKPYTSDPYREQI